MASSIQAGRHLARVLCILGGRHRSIADFPGDHWVTLHFGDVRVSYCVSGFLKQVAAIGSPFYIVVVISSFCCSAPRAAIAAAPQTSPFGAPLVPCPGALGTASRRARWLARQARRQYNYQLLSAGEPQPRFDDACREIPKHFIHHPSRQAHFAAYFQGGPNEVTPQRPKGMPKHAQALTNGEVLALAVSAMLYLWRR